MIESIGASLSQTTHCKEGRTKVSAHVLQVTWEHFDSTIDTYVGSREVQAQRMAIQLKHVRKK